MIGGLLGNPMQDGVIDPRRMAMMGLFQNIGSIIAGGQARANPGQMFMQAQMYNQNADTRQAENELRRMQIEQARAKIEQDAKRRGLIQQAMGGGAPTETMGPAMPGMGGQTQVMPGYNAADIQGTGVPDMDALAQIAAMEDPMAYLEYQMEKNAPVAPEFQTINQGGNEVTYQMMPDGSMKQIATSPRWKPELGGVEAPWGADPENQQKMRKEFYALPEAKAFGEVDTNFRQLAGSLQSGSRTDQLAAIFGFMRSLDPGSVVRESETGMLQKTGSVFDRFNTYIRGLQKGEVLPPEVMKDMLETANRQYQVRARRFNELQGEFSGHAQAAGVPPERVVGQTFSPFDPYGLEAGGAPIGATGPNLAPDVTPPPPMTPVKGTKEAIPPELWGTARDPYSKDRTLQERERGRRLREEREEQEKREERRSNARGQMGRNRESGGRNDTPYSKGYGL